MNRRQFLDSCICSTSGLIVGCHAIHVDKKQHKQSSKPPIEPYELTACGLDCTKCPLFKDKCDGCRADLKKHWSADCPILNCCVVDKKLSNCAMCDDFPCGVTKTFKEKGGKYSVAINRLHGIAKKE